MLCKHMEYCGKLLLSSSNMQLFEEQLAVLLKLSRVTATIVGRHKIPTESCHFQSGKGGKKFLACLYGKRSNNPDDLLTCILIIFYSNIFNHIDNFTFIVLTIIVPVFDLDR